MNNGKEGAFCMQNTPLVGGVRGPCRLGSPSTGAAVGNRPRPSSQAPHSLSCRVWLLSDAHLPFQMRVASRYGHRGQWAGGAGPALLREAARCGACNPCKEVEFWRRRAGQPPEPPHRGWRGKVAGPYAGGGRRTRPVLSLLLHLAFLPTLPPPILPSLLPPPSPTLPGLWLPAHATTCWNLAVSRDTKPRQAHSRWATRHSELSLQVNTPTTGLDTSLLWVWLWVGIPESWSSGDWQDSIGLRGWGPVLGLGGLLKK